MAMNENRGLLGRPQFRKSCQIIAFPPTALYLAEGYSVPTVLGTFITTLSNTNALIITFLGGTAGAGHADFRATAIAIGFTGPVTATRTHARIVNIVVVAHRTNTTAISSAGVVALALANIRIVRAITYRVRSNVRRLSSNVLSPTHAREEG